MQRGLQRHLQGTPFNAFVAQPSPFPDPARASFLSAVKLQEQPFAYGQPGLASKAPAFLFLALALLLIFKKSSALIPAYASCCLNDMGSSDSATSLRIGHACTIDLLAGHRVIELWPYRVRRGVVARLRPQWPLER